MSLRGCPGLTGPRFPRSRADNLTVALEHSREIGIAIGILMSTYRIGRDDGFDILRLFSRRARRKAADIAADVATDIATMGTLPDLPDAPAPRTQRRTS